MWRRTDAPSRYGSLLDQNALYHWVSSRWTASQFVLLSILSMALIAGALDELNDSILSAEVRALTPERKHADVVQFTLWREADPGLAASIKRGEQPTVRYWHDKSTDTVWIPIGHTQARHKTTYDELEPGNYRVSVATAADGKRSDPTPYGMSEVFAVRKGRGKVSITVQQKGDTPLTLSLVDVNTKHPLENVSLTLFREDGLPIGFGSGDFSQRTGKDGLVEFGSLVPGRYYVVAHRRAYRFGEHDYSLPKNHFFNVKPGRLNYVEISLHPTPLSDQEINERWPFIVTGRVTDTAGKPLEGVKITAHCGVGTLIPTGETHTDAEGRYTLRFTGGIWFIDEETGNRQIGLQAATIHAHFPNYYDIDLWRQGDLSIADEMPPETDVIHFVGVVLPKQPYQLDFTMTPAVRIEGMLVTPDGKPLSGARVHLCGDKLPPSCSVMSATETQANGRFIMSEIPCERFWYEVRDEEGEEFRTNPFYYKEPGIYDVQLSYSKRFFDEPEIGCIIRRKSK